MAFKAIVHWFVDFVLMEHGSQAMVRERHHCDVTPWYEEALKHLPLILKGENRRGISVTKRWHDAFNAVMTEGKNFSLTKSNATDETTASSLPLN